MNKRKTEAVTPPELLTRLAAAADQEVLVGGQALAAWVGRYGLVVPDDMAAISNDVDFLARSAGASDRVRHLARVMDGQVHFPSENSLTALVGQAYRDISDDEYLNVDVIFKVIGLTAEAVRQEAIEFSIGKTRFLVMHPLHVLKSRLWNLHKLREKQNDKGALQLSLAIEVARAFLQEEAQAATADALASGRSPVQHYVSDIVRMAKSDAGRKVAVRTGLHVADAIDPSLIPAGPFWDKAWPTLQPLMSPAYGARFEPPEEAVEGWTSPRP